MRLKLPLSNETLLRLVRRRGAPSFPSPKAAGIDDWAWKRNQRYGTLICDLERRRTISLLPDREPATAQAWLQTQPQIEVMTRNRGGGYALAAARALPHAMQEGLARVFHQMPASRHLHGVKPRLAQRPFAHKSLRPCDCIEILNNF